MKRTKKQWLVIIAVAAAVTLVCTWLGGLVGRSWGETDRRNDAIELATGTRPPADPTGLYLTLAGIALVSIALWVWLRNARAVGRFIGGLLGPKRP